jgi:hypothetical protein
MTWRDASRGEMPTSPAPGRAEPELDEQLLDAILAGQHLPPDAPDQAHVVAEMLASLAGPADPGDLAAERAVRSAFSHAAAQVSPQAAAPAPAAVPTRPRHTQPFRNPRGKGRARKRQRSSWLPARLSARLAATLAAVVVVLGGTVAAYAGVLPGPIQDLAHRAIDAPAAHHPAGYQLCVAYERDTVEHNAPAMAAAFRGLARLAGGASKVSAFCISVGEPVDVAPSASGRPASSPAGRIAPPGQQKPRHQAHPKQHPKGKSRGKAKGHTRSQRPKKPTKAKNPGHQAKNHEKRKEAMKQAL